MPTKKDPRLARAGVSGYNKPKRTPSHAKKSHVVVAKQGEQVKTIRFGEQGASTAGKPKSGSDREPSWSHDEKQAPICKRAVRQHRRSDNSAYPGVWIIFDSSAAHPAVG